GPGMVRILGRMLHQPHGRLLELLQRLAQRADELPRRLVAALVVAEFLDEGEIAPDGPAAVGRELAADEVHGLDAVGALVNGRDAGVADELLHAPFADIAVAAIDL